MKFQLSLFPNVGHSHWANPVTLTWEQLCYRFAHPRIRAEKDGQLFSAAIFKNKQRGLAAVSEISMLVFDSDYQATMESLKGALKKLQTAFAIYSTHSHCRVVPCRNCEESKSHTLHTGNINATPKYRVVIPLLQPIRAMPGTVCFAEHELFDDQKDALLPARVVYGIVWPKVMEIVGWEVTDRHEGKLTEVDNIVKNSACIYYTPVKASSAAPYEFHIQPGAFLDWQKLCASEERAPARSASVQRQGEAAGQESSFETHEDRHDELCRRIVARGKRNSSGKYDAKCLAHGGRGDSAVLYNPDSLAVSCNAGCDYYALLQAEGLPIARLQTRQQVAQWAKFRKAKEESGQAETPHVEVAAAEKISIIYSVLLAHLLTLSERDEALIRRELHGEPISPCLVEYPAGGREPAPLKICSMPTFSVQSIAVGELAKWFDLSGVPGFYRDEVQLPQMRGGQKPRHSWRINLPYVSGLLAPYSTPSGYIVGIRIYQFTEKRNGIASQYLRTPFLLSSARLPGGAKAVAVREAAA